MSQRAPSSKGEAPGHQTPAGGAVRAPAGAAALAVLASWMGGPMLTRFGGKARRRLFDAVPQTAGAIINAATLLEHLRARQTAFARAHTIKTALLAVAIGVLVGYAAIAFRLLIGGTQFLWLGTIEEAVVTGAQALPWWGILLAPIVGGAIVGQILQHCMPGRRVHGVADVIEARAFDNCRLDLRTGLWSALVSALSLGFGASAGREGPVVHLGATLAANMQAAFSLPAANRRILLAAGVGAAVSASFNAPIAGVLFACEVILGHFALSAFVPTVIASVAATLISRSFFGETSAFLIPEYMIASYWEFPAFALLGLTCGVVAIIFQSTLITTDRLATATAMPIWARPIVGGVFVGAIAVFYPHVLGVGYEATDQALKAQLPLALMLTLLIAKTAATAITLASRFGGGIFSASLYLGAMTGGAFGQIAAMAFPEAASTYGLYAILGMGAVAASMLGAPISTTVIVFELTGGYEVTIALLLTVSVANTVSQAVLGQSFFAWQLAQRGKAINEGPHQEILRRLCVRDFMTRADAEAERARRKERLKGADGEEDDDPLRRDPDKPWLMTTDTVEAALRTFDKSGSQRIAVVHEADKNRIVGWATHIDTLNAFNAALIDAHVEEHR